MPRLINHDMDTAQAPTLLEWCAGYGGIGLGLKRAIPNLRTIAFCEREGYACANLVAKMEAGLLDVAPIWTDVKTFPCAEFRGKVDIFVAGYPCQPFSLAGKRKGQDDPRHLWPFIQRAVAVIRPRYCFFENVAGHLTLGFKDVCHDLGELGYEIAAGLFTAAECGAPHERKRLYILAHSNVYRLERNRLCKKSLPSNDAKASISPPISICQEVWHKSADCVLGISDGSKFWVDRLRLLGNGVVPAVAELAWRTLWRELNHDRT